nr:hypothetical protein [Tanacetum cinerariifolium]
MDLPRTFDKIMSIPKRIVLSIEDKLNYLEQPIPPAPVAHAGQHKEGQSVSSYVLKMKGYIDNLERLGHPVTLGLGLSLVLIGLHKEYDGFVQNYNMHSMGKIVNELHAMLKLHEQTLPKNNAPALHAIRAGKVQKVNKHKKSQTQMAARGQNHGKGKNKLAYAPKPKIPPPPKREDPVKESICHECGETGHRKRNCPQYLAELLKKKKNAASGDGGSGIFVIELNTILNRSWIYDTGSGTHICNTMLGLRASRKLKPGALSLYVGNGQREAVKAIGVFYLCLPIGLDIVLKNFHYAPDGIFEIDSSNSYTNKSSIYDVSNKRAKLDLDSALLWHCRLGHISKKRIEKLQHDGFLNSTDLRAFEKCVSCMSGKMARKPYTHQVKRSKDLLGLIHTNVCGPFKIISRQGASYFVTFTDDFSRYGYVYMLKHKHEVFETFKVFQKEVENQLGYPKKTMGYSFYYPPENKARNAKFLEKSLITQEASGSLEDLEIIQEEDTHPSIDTSLNHKEDDLEIDEPQSDIIPIRRSTRTRRLTYRMCLYIDAEEHELGDLDEPANYKAALLDPEYDKWLNAMNKARLVVKGYTQTPGIDYEETFSPVADIRAIRMLIATAAYYDYEIWKMDVKTDFLIGYLNEEVYMKQPEGFVNLNYPNRRYHMENSKHGSIPMQEKLRLSKSQGASTPAELKHMKNVPYTSAVGSIMNTKDMFLVYKGDLKRELRVSCYIDAGYLTDANDLKSQVGYVFVLNGGAVDWKSAKQSIFVTLSAKAEYIAAFDASKEAAWVRKFISGLGIVSTIEEPISMYCDNTGAIVIANESRITKGARHFRAKVHYLREVIEYGDVKLEKIHTNDNLAGPFTKALAFPKHSEHTRNSGMLPASSLM